MNLSDLSFNFKSFIFLLIIFFFLLILIIYKKNVFIKKILNIYIIFFISIFSLEYILFLFLENKNNILKKRILAAKEKNLIFDQRTKYDFLYENKKKGKEIYPVIFPKDFLLNPLYINDIPKIPLSGLRNKNTVYCNEEGYYSKYKSDRYGFNNQDTIWNKIDQKKNILLIGDSYVHGACVNFNSTISSHLNNKNKEFSFFNLGMGGNGTLLNFATLKEYGKIIKPKKVIWFFFEGNDYNDFNKEIQSSILLSYLDKKFDQELIRDNSVIDLQINLYYEKLYKNYEPKNRLGKTLRLYTLRSKFAMLNQKFKTNLNFFKSPKNYYQKNNNLTVKNKNKLLYEVFKIAKEITNEWNSELIIFILPDYGYYYDKVIKRKKYTEIFDVLDNLKINYLDFYDYLKDYSNIKELFPLGLPGHYNSKGYELIADIILNKEFIDRK